jgi:hypothetical protein
MKRLLFAIVFLAAAVMTTAAASAQVSCANENLGKGEGKFTGQISGGPNGSLIEVTSGNETALVHYSNSSVLVCEGGQPAPVNRLVTGATVVVYGPMKKKGKVTDITALKILVAGSTQSSDSTNSNYNKSARGASESTAFPWSSMSPIM